MTKDGERVQREKYQNCRLDTEVFLAFGERRRTMTNECAGGEGGIRTPDTVTRMPHFECGAFNHSATSPWPQGANILSVGGYVSNARRLNKNALSPMQRLIMSPRARGAGRRTWQQASHYRAATFSPTHPMIRSAICKLFLSIISMWLLPLWPASGSSRNFAEPPADLMALTVAAHPLRRSSPFGPGAPWLLSPHTDSSGTLE